MATDQAELLSLFRFHDDLEPPIQPIAKVPTIEKTAASSFVETMGLAQAAAFAPTTIESITPAEPSLLALTPDGYTAGSRLAQGNRFSIFNQDHANEAADVYKALLSVERAKFWHTCRGLKSFLNEGLYFYAVNVAVQNRLDTNMLEIPPMCQLNPRAYFTGPAVANAWAAATKKENTNTEKTIPATRIEPSKPTPEPKLFETGNEKDPEFKLAWWREDIGLNMHHFHFHVVYPHRGGENDKTKDRQGELFYYMHQQKLARYDAERIAVGLPRVQPYEDWGYIKEGYDSHLTDYYGAHQYTPRPKHMTLTGNVHPEDDLLEDDVNQQKIWYQRIKEAVKTGLFKTPNMGPVPVNIDNLGAAVESSVSSPDEKWYGGLHNRGHVLIANVTDPDHRYNQQGGVMLGTETAIRDPIFYRWHKFVDNIFAQHKETLDPYTKSELSFEGIVVDNVKIGSDDTITTNMKKETVDIANDMFIVKHKDPLTGKLKPPNTKVFVQVNRVAHGDFSYSFTVTNNTGKDALAAFRVFLAPKTDENGKPIPMGVQRRLFIEMDKFTKTLTTGENPPILRKSTDSSVIRPPEKTYEEIQEAADSGTCDPSQDDCSCRDQRYCKCGWPYNMLVPRGTADGMTFDLFVMLTNWWEDRVNTNDLDQGTSYCGVQDDDYPDKRAMGFPFDRKLSQDYDTLDKLVDGFPNMHRIPITVKFE